MTREEAIREIETVKQCEVDTRKQIQALDMALAALRPITREQVEKVWRGEWIDRRALNDAPVECSNCGEWVYGKLQDANFCPFCGVPMTDEAVDMVMERLEELRDEKG